MGLGRGHTTRRRRETGARAEGEADLVAAHVHDEGEDDERRPRAGQVDRRGRGGAGDGRRELEGGGEEQQRAWMVKRSENGVLGGLWLEGHGLSVGSEVPGLSSRVRRAAPSLHMQTDEPVEASYGLAKTATLTMLAAPSIIEIPTKRTGRRPKRSTCEAARVTAGWVASSHATLSGGGREGEGEGGAPRR